MNRLQINKSNFLLNYVFLHQEFLINDHAIFYFRVAQLIPILCSVEKRGKHAHTLYFTLNYNSKILTTLNKSLTG
jgi:hypothetical protein